MRNKLGVVLIFVFVILVGIGGYFWVNSGPVVSAEGFSSIKVVPDEVSVQITIETRNKSAEDAQKKNKEITEKLISELKKIGFNEKDLKFVNQYVSPEYDYSDYRRPKIVGYVVSQQVVVKTKEVDRVPTIVDATISSGALVNYINFEVSSEKQSEYKNRVLEEASEDARKKAESIANGQGKKLWKLVSLVNKDYYYPGPIPLYKYEEESFALQEDANLKARSSAMNLSPQEQEITATILAEYKLTVF